jgi:hypothetical protein
MMELFDFYLSQAILCHALAAFLHSKDLIEKKAE